MGASRLDGPIRHTRSIAAHGIPPDDRERPAHGPQSEQATGSLERVSLPGPEQDALIAHVREAAFPLALRGYDREAVDAYVKRVNRLVTDLEASRSPEAAIRRALDKVGEETSGILQRAQQTANEITERSRASADDRIREAERQARALLVEAEDRVRELEADYGEIWARRDRLLEEVRDLAERLLATADDATERFPTQEEEEEVGGVQSRADTASFPRVEAPGEQLGAASDEAPAGPRATEDAGAAAELGRSHGDEDLGETAEEDEDTTQRVPEIEPVPGPPPAPPLGIRSLDAGPGLERGDRPPPAGSSEGPQRPVGEDRPEGGEGAGGAAPSADEMDFADAPGEEPEDDDRSVGEGGRERRFR